MTLFDYLAARNLFILVAVLLIAVTGLLLFLRKRGDRHPMDNARGRALDERRARETSEGT